MFVNFKMCSKSLVAGCRLVLRKLVKIFVTKLRQEFIFRTREFEIGEFEYFIKPDAWEATFEMWLGESNVGGRM